MVIEINRNDPCPCGSGKKFKKCCYDKELHQSGPSSQEAESPPHGEVPQPPEFQFKAGSFGMDGQHVSSIACLKKMENDQWDYFFLLVRPNVFFKTGEEAETSALEDLDGSLEYQNDVGTDEAMAEYLQECGYVPAQDVQ